MVIVTRIKTLEHSAVYQVFAITDPALVTLLLKMVNRYQKNSHNSFSLRKACARRNFVSQKDFALSDEQSLLYSMKKKTHFNHTYSLNTEDKRVEAAEKLVMRKLRIFKMKSVFDSITLSKDLLEDVNKVMITFDISMILF